MLGSPTGAPGLSGVLFLRLPSFQSSGPLLFLSFLSESLGRLALFLPPLYVFLFLLVLLIGVSFGAHAGPQLGSVLLPQYLWCWMAFPF